MYNNLLLTFKQTGIFTKKKKTKQLVKTRFPVYRGVSLEDFIIIIIITTWDVNSLAVQSTNVKVNERVWDASKSNLCRNVESRS